MQLPTSLAPETGVREVMSPGVIALPADTTVGACAITMAQRRTHAVLILDPQTRRPQGWLSQHDVLRRITDDPLTTLASEAATQEIAYIDPDASVDSARTRMVSEGRSHLLVAASEDAVPLGVLSVGDLVGFYARLYGRGT